MLLSLVGVAAAWLVAAGRSVSCRLVGLSVGLTSFKRKLKANFVE